jgi:hypothetical protein
LQPVTGFHVEPVHSIDEFVAIKQHLLIYISVLRAFLLVPLFEKEGSGEIL